MSHADARGCIPSGKGGEGERRKEGGRKKRVRKDRREGGRDKEGRRKKGGRKETKTKSGIGSNMGYAGSSSGLSPSPSLTPISLQMMERRMRIAPKGKERPLLPIEFKEHADWFI